MSIVVCPHCKGGGAMAKIADLEQQISVAFKSADHWMARKEECARENAKLACLLDDAEEELKQCLFVHAKTNDQNERTKDENRFVMWEIRQLRNALAAIKVAGSKGEMRRIAMQAIDANNWRLINESI